MTKSITVKRPVTIKTIVTQEFKQQALEELNKEIQLLENQILQLELQNKQIQDQFKAFTSFNEDGLKEIQDAIEDISNRLGQMNLLKQQLKDHKDQINHVTLDNIVITGSLENYVELKIGENIYEKFKEAEILVKNGIIQEIIS
jgi:Rad3-related DNA helicase